jgi:hemoglobin/transferrin/lactoferrin receptor protein
MRNNILICVVLFSFINIYGQYLEIRNNSTLQGISKVKITSEKSKIELFSNEIGLIDSKEFKENETYLFVHPWYQEVVFSYEHLKANSWKIYLTEKIVSIDEVVVSASKFEEKAKDVSQSIQVLRKTDLENMNQSSTADVISNSGKIMVQKSQLGGGSPIIRGFETNKVLMVIDGVRLNNAIYRGGHLQNILSLDNAIMEKVEIVYGPGSVIYGSDALGGVMHFYTKDPVFSATEKKLIKANVYTRYMTAVNGYSTHFDVSVGSKRLGSITSFSYSNFGDLRQGANREPQVGNFGARSWYVKQINGLDSMVQNKDTNLQVGSAYSQYDLFQKFVFKQSKTLKHKINFQYSSTSNIPRYDRLVQMTGSNPKFGEWNYGPQKRLLGAYSLEFSKSYLLYDFAKIILSYQQVEESRIDRRYKDVNQNNRIENLDVISGNFDFAKKTGKQEIRYGIDVWYNKVKSTAFSKDITTGVENKLDTRYASGGSTMNSAAIYISHTWEISEKFILNDGFRFSNIGLTAKFTDTTFFNFPFKNVKQNNNALTGNIGLVYIPTDNSRVTALFSTGFRAPNVDDLSKVFESSPGNIIVPNANIKPEYTYNSEIGISNKFDNSLTIQATGYYTLYENVLTVQNFTYEGKDSIFYAGTKSKVLATTNANKAYIYGLELSLNANFNEHISFFATYNYTHARIVTDSLAIPLDHIPPVFGKLGIQIKERKFRADLFVNYSAWKRIADYNPFGEDNQAYALPEGMPSWYTINARISYQFNKFVSLQVACENILDRNYRVFASNISAPGRNFILTLRGSF